MEDKKIQQWVDYTKNIDLTKMDDNAKNQMISAMATIIKVLGNSILKRNAKQAAKESTNTFMEQLKR